MLAYRTFDLAAHRQGYSESLELLGQRLEQLIQFLVAAAAQEFIVEIIVQLERDPPFALFMRIFELVVEFFHFFYVVFAHPVACKLCGISFKDAFNLVKIPYVLFCDRSDISTPVSLYLYEPFCLKLPYCLSDRRPADVELVGHFCFCHTFFGLKNTLYDSVPYGIRYLFPQRLFLLKINLS